MEVFGIICPNCMQFVYSRAGHDFITCDCGRCSVDGGQDGMCTRVCADMDKLGIAPVTIWVELNVDQAQLYTDWNHQANAYGHLKLEDLVDHSMRMKGKQVGNTWRSRLKLWMFNHGWCWCAIWLTNRLNGSENFYTFLRMIGVQHDLEVKPNESN